MTEIKSLQGVKITQVLDTFNESFSDYLVPMNLTLEQFNSKLHTENINWDYSIGVFFDSNLCGFILHFEDFEKGKKILYNGGTGVIPTQRGNHWTQKMYETFYPIFKENGVEEMVLEVLAANEKAIKVYQKIGFETERIVKCFRGTIPQDLTLHPEIQIKEIQTADWGIFQSFWEVLPTWQNTPSVLDRTDTKKIVGAYLDDKLVGYAIYNPTTKRLNQLAVDPQHRRKYIAETLLSEIGKKEEAEFTLLNVDEDATGLLSLLQKMNWKNTVDQLEMRLKIS
jgi:ribosomal protein S18 acetylase RimI-like enzyme